MPGSYTNPYGSQVVASTIGRVERVERQTVRPTGVPAETMIFSYPATLLNNVESPPWYPSKSGSVEFVRVSLLAIATTTHTVALNIGGAQVTTFSLSSGLATSVFGQLGFAAAYNQPITIKTISVTDSNMVVEVHLR